MSYKIKYVYTTGDSFHTEENKSELLEFEWENAEIVKQNLEYIRQHYELYKLLNGRSWEWPKKYKSREEIIRQHKNNSWFVAGYPDSCLNLLTDSGEYFQMYAPWCGYFEILHRVEIVTDLSIDF